MSRALVAALVLLAPLASTAHSVPHPRVISIHASRGKIQAQFTLELGRAEASSARRLFDFDRDGTLRGPEREKLGHWLELRAVGGFELRGEKGALVAEKTRSSPQGIADPKANLGIRVLLTYSVPEGAGAFTVSDEGDALGHVPVRVEAEDVTVKFGAVKLGAAYDLPARTPVSLVVSPAK